MYLSRVWSVYRLIEQIQMCINILTVFARIFSLRIGKQQWYLSKSQPNVRPHWVLYIRGSWDLGINVQETAVINGLQPHI